MGWQPPISRRRLAFLVLACALVTATGLRVAGVADKRSLTGDESISYLAAACHQGDYAQLAVAERPPFGRWVARPNGRRCCAPTGRCAWVSAAKDRPQRQDGV